MGRGMKIETQGTLVGLGLWLFGQIVLGLEPWTVLYGMVIMLGASQWERSARHRREEEVGRG